MTTEHKIAADDLSSAQLNGRDPRAAVVVTMLNAMSAAMCPFRNHETAPEMETMLITAAITYAGTLHGELVALGMSPDLTPDAIDRLLMINYRTGINAGKQHVEHAVFNLFAEEQVTTGQGNPS